MNFLKKIFGSKNEEKIMSYAEFWAWFQLHEREFYLVVKDSKDIHFKFFDKPSPKLEYLDGKYFFVTGMYNSETVELIFTAEGVIKNIPFVEELVNCAPVIDGWRFTALKPAIDISDINIKMDGYQFDKNNISFYSDNSSGNADEINITVVHHDYTDENKNIITNGTYIYLDNLLGELNFAAIIDNISLISSSNAVKDLAPIEKLNDFIAWRQKEFVEKYDGKWHDSETDSHSILEFQTKNGNGIVAVVNTDLLKWDAKASHPWMMQVEIKYDGLHNNGMPETETVAVLNEIEKEINGNLKKSDGYLNIGRETGLNTRSIYIACKDFRKPAKIMMEIIKKYRPNPEINFDIFKDKYWSSVKHFMPS